MEKKYKNSLDFDFLVARINEFIRVGFNRKKDIKAGNLRVIPSQECVLFYVVFLSTLSDFSRERGDWATFKLVKFRSKELDFSRILEGVYNNRVHRRHVKVYKRFDCTLRQDEKIRETAILWYKSRVVYSGPEEFCKKYLLEKGIELRPENVGREIFECDLVTGYPRKNLAKDAIFKIL